MNCVIPGNCSRLKGVPRRVAAHRRGLSQINAAFLDPPESFRQKIQPQG